MKKTLFLLFTLALFASCVNEQKKEMENNDLYFFNDFECVRGWGDANTITSGVAHSGKYFSKIDSVKQFSYGFKLEKKSISDTLLNKVAVSIWVLTKDIKTKACIVAQITRNDSSIYWQKSEIKNFIAQPLEWDNAKAEFILPKDIKPKDKILIYVWNADGKSEVDVDDLEVQFYK
jgi:hypothetical protein